MKKALLITLAVITTGLVVYLTTRVLTTGTVIIETNSATATAFEVAPGTKDKKLGKGKRIKSRQSPGIHHFAVRDGNKETRVSTDVGARRSVTLKADLIDIDQPERLANFIAYDIVEQAGILRFLNKGASQLYQLRQGEIRGNELVPDTYPIARVWWLDFETALIEMRDARLLVFSKGAVVPLRLPSDLQAIGEKVPHLRSASFNTSGSLLVQLDDKLLVYQNLLADPQRRLDVEVGMLSELSDSGRILLYPEEGREVHGGTQDDKAYIMNPDGSRNDLPLYSTGTISFARWLPGQDTVLYSTADHVGLSDLASGTTKLVSGFALDSVSAVVFGSPTEVFAISDGSVWRLDLSNLAANKLAKLPGSVLHPDALAISSDKAALLFGTSPTKGLVGGAELYHLPIR